MDALEKNKNKIYFLVAKPQIHIHRHGSLSIITMRLLVLVCFLLQIDIHRILYLFQSKYWWIIDPKMTTILDLGIFILISLTADCIGRYTILYLHYKYLLEEFIGSVVICYRKTLDYRSENNGINSEKNAILRS